MSGAGAAMAVSAAIAARQKAVKWSKLSDEEKARWREEWQTKAQQELEEGAEEKEGVEGEEGGGKKGKAKPNPRDNLAVTGGLDRDAWRRHKYGTDEDRKECRFRPQKSRAAQRIMRSTECGYDFANKAKGETEENFIQRMFLAEKERQQELKNKRGEMAYEEQQDKKVPGDESNTLQHHEHEFY